MSIIPDNMFQSGQFDPIEGQRAYAEHGYIVLKNVFSRDEVEALRTETRLICTGERGDLVGADLVTQQAGSPGDAVKRVLAIHFPHKVSDLMRSTLFQPSILKALNAVIGPDVKCMQSMLFVKTAGKPGQAWHQDEAFIPTQDKSLAGVWIALDDARVENGALWMHPGSHKHGKLWPMQPNQDRRFDASPEAVGYPYDRDGGVPVEADAGDVVVFHGFVLHRSLNNVRKDGFRRALVNHVMSAHSLLPWRLPGLSDVQAEDYRDVVMISGDDPFSDKGLADLSIPYLRPEDPQQAQQVADRLKRAVDAAQR